MILLLLSLRIIATSNHLRHSGDWRKVVFDLTEDKELIVCLIVNSAVCFHIIKYMQPVI